MTTRTKSIAVVTTFLALATVMFVFTPDEPSTPVTTTTTTLTPAPIIEPAPILPDEETPTPPTQSRPLPLLSLPPISRALTTAARATPKPMPCVRIIEFTPPVLLYPPHNRPFTNITVKLDGVDYGKRDVVKLSREVWQTTVPSECDQPSPDVIIIDFWPNHPQDAGSPLRIAVAPVTVVVKE